MRGFLTRFIGALTLAAVTLGAQQTAKPPSWLDRPLANWNKPAQPVPRATASDEPRGELQKRCQFPARQETAAERALTDAGWIPYLYFDRQIVQRDVEILGGMIAADGMCRPAHFNVFVFVGGRFAGTLSPQLMTSRLDASIGAVRLAADDTIAAEFARYRNDDPLCCPSSRLTVRFRLDRQEKSRQEKSGPAPVIIPIDVRTTRG